jgi:hypothetical protein
MRHLARAALLLAALAGLPALAPSHAAAQAALDAAQAAPFLGSWSTTLDSPEGAIPTTVSVADAGGKVALEVEFQGLGPAVPATDVARDGDLLVARFSLNYQGMDLPTVLKLSPDGANLKADWDFADGGFVVVTTATKN